MRALYCFQKDGMTGAMAFHRQNTGFQSIKNGPRSPAAGEGY